MAHKIGKGDLYFTVGLPRSGKSTFAAEWVRTPGVRPRVVVDGDFIRQAIHGHEYIHKAETYVFAVRNTMIEALLLGGNDVLVDDTNTSRRSLYSMFCLDQNAKYFIFLTDVETCVKRAEEMGQHSLIKSIRRMNLNLYDLSLHPNLICDLGYKINEENIRINIEHIREQTCQLLSAQS